MIYSASFYPAPIAHGEVRMADGPDQVNPPSGISRATKSILGVSALLAALVGAIKYGKDLIEIIPWRRSVVTVEVSTEPRNLPAEIAVGSKLPLKATPKGATGEVLFGRAVQWSSDPPEVAGVSSDGIVTGKTRGDAIITVSCEKVSGFIRVHVGHIAVREVVVFPPHKQLRVRESLRLDATPRDAQGIALDNSEPPKWASDSDAVATVSLNGGIVTGVGPGSTTVSAEIDGQLGSATIVVPAPPPQPPSGIPPPPAGGLRAKKTGELPPERAAMAVVHPVLGVRPTVAVMASPSISRAVRIVLVNGPEMSGCIGHLRILLGETLVELGSSSQTVSLPAAGTTNYTVGGTASCPGRALTHGSGQGSINVNAGKRFAVRLKYRRPTDAVVQLVEE